MAIDLIFDVPAGPLQGGETGTNAPAPSLVPLPEGTQIIPLSGEDTPAQQPARSLVPLPPDTEIIPLPAAPPAEAAPTPAAPSASSEAATPAEQFAAGAAQPTGAGTAGIIPAASAALPPPTSAPRAKDSWEIASSLIQKYESGGQNIPNAQGSGAFGPWQIIGSTWAAAAPSAGVDVAKYPTADSAPPAVQEQVAKTLYDKDGYSHWAPYNPALARAIGWTGPMWDYANKRMGGPLPAAKMEGPGWKVSPAAVASEQARTDTSVKYMSPADYLEMTPDSSSVKTDAYRAVRQRLDAGNALEALPSIDVTQDASGALKVVSNDGRARALAAQDAGIELIPVAIHGAPPTREYTQIQGARGQPQPFVFPDVPKIEASSAVGRVMTGIGDVGVGVIRAASQAREPIASMMPQSVRDATSWASPAVIDRLSREREQRYEGGRIAAGSTGIDWARLAGNIIGGAPVAAAVGGAMGAAAPAAGALTLGRAVAQGAVQGAVGGAIGAGVPGKVEHGSYMANVATDALLGAIGGGAFATAGKVIGSVIAPQLSAAAKRLAGGGVRLTPGRMMGETASRYEDKLTSIPGAGDIMIAGLRRQLQDFNIAVYNRILGVVGLKYDSKLLGYDGVEAVGNKLSKLYDNLKGRIHFDANARFLANMVQIRRLATTLPGDEQGQWDAIIAGYVSPRLAATANKPVGYMDGTLFKELESELTAFARSSYRGAAQRPAQRMLGERLDDLLGALRQNLEDVNPGERVALRRLNTAWAAFKEIEAAAANRSTSSGIFSPSDLLVSQKRLSGIPAFVRGAGLLKQIARDAQAVIGSKYPDSGTAGRLLTAAAGAGGAAGYFGMLNPATIGLTAGAAATYTGAGMSALRRAALAGPLRQAIGRDAAIAGQLGSVGLGLAAGGRR